MEIQEGHKLGNVRAKIQSQDCDYKAMHLTAILCCENKVANLKIKAPIISNLATPRPKPLIDLVNMNVSGVVDTGDTGWMKQANQIEWSLPLENNRIKVLSNLGWLLHSYGNK